MKVFNHPFNKENCKKRLLEEYHRYGKLIVAFDFDNTIYDYHNDGGDYSEVIKLLRDCSKLGFELVLFTTEEYKKNYKFDCTCEGSVIEAIVIGANSVSYEDCIKTSIYLGGDVDTIACMAGMVCDCDPSEELEKWAWNKLPERMQNVIEKFENEIKSH